ncbi:MAG TPA: N-acetylmuramoyl-L-alanine amidase [Blastocatellia bacterium]|nr:N-acetylmuramoyl-L-alanine amidase [Blastocatellia bacterium]
MKRILVSAGHSDADPGVVANGYREADLAERFRDTVAAMLRASGLPVVTDGDLGVNLPLTQAIRLQRQADLFVEFHFNAPAPGSGVEALSNAAQKQLSQSLAGAIARVTGLRLRGDGGWKLPGSGAHSTLGFCRAGGIILECCFLTSAEDVKRWLASENDCAQALAQSLARAAGQQV